MKVYLTLVTCCLLSLQSLAASFISPDSGIEVFYEIHLPPSYETSDQDYPVIYFLHGAGAHYAGHFRSETLLTDIQIAYDRELIEESIIVYANGYFDTMWADSFDGTKPAESTVIFDLIPYIEGNFRVRPGPDYRAVIGYSMGGRGAAGFIAKYPDTFCCSVMMDGAFETFSALNDSIRTEIFNDDETYYSAFDPYLLATQNATALQDKPLRLVLAAIGSMYDFEETLIAAGITYERAEYDIEHRLDTLLSVDDQRVWGFLGEQFGDIPTDDDPPEPGVGAQLTHGPIYGNVRPYSAEIMVRTDQAAEVSLKLVRLDEFGQPDQDPIYTPVTQTSEEADFTANFVVNGLSPESLYAVNVDVDGQPQFETPETSAGPSFKTFVPRGSEREFSFAALSDFTNMIGRNTDSFFAGMPYQTYDNIANENPAFVFIGGDFDHRHASGIDNKRTTYKQLYDANPDTALDSGGLLAQRVLNKFPIAHHWDDHDAGVNNADKTYSGWGETYQAYLEYVPNYIGRAPPPGIWQRFSYAQAEFFVLDNRSQRDPSWHPDDANKSMLNGDNLTGDSDQYQWLVDSLHNSAAKWKIIFSSVNINPAIKPDDSWAAYQNEWNRLKADIAGIEGIVFITGDLHVGAIDSGVASGYPEVVIPPANMPDRGINGSRCSSGQVPNGSFDIGVFGMPWSSTWTGECAGYVVGSFKSTPDILELYIKDQFGNTRLEHTVELP